MPWCHSVTGMCSLAVDGISASCAITPSDRTPRAVRPIARSGISGLPLPGGGGKVAPAGSECNLAVLDWAGFDGAASYTFDDSQPSHIAHWEDLKATGVPMTFYINPVHNRAANFDATWKDALAAGCELGNHSNAHKRLAEHSGGTAELAADIEACATYIAETLGQSGPCSFAYPFGETGWKDAFEGRFLLARTVNTGTVKPLDAIDPLMLPVFAVTSAHTEKNFTDALDRSIAERSWVIFMFHSLLPGDNWYAGVPADSVTGSITHGRASGKLWIDTVERIGSYWLACKMFASLVSTGDANAKTWTWSLPEGYPADSYLRVRVDGGTLSQNGSDLAWNDHGFYEVALDAGVLSWQR